MQAANLAARMGQGILSRADGAGKTPSPISGWTDHRELPIARKPFRSLWRDLQDEDRPQSQDANLAEDSR